MVSKDSQTSLQNKCLFFLNFLKNKVLLLSTLTISSFYEIGYNTIKPIYSKIAAIHKIPSPSGKVVPMSSIGALNFYTKFIEKHYILKPFYDLLHENNPWKWTDEHERLFQKLKMSLISETELTLPNTKRPFLITVDASLIGLGAVLFQ